MSQIIIFLSTKILQVKKKQNHEKTYLTEVIKSISNKYIYVKVLNHKRISLFLIH